MDCANFVSGSDDYGGGCSFANASPQGTIPLAAQLEAALAVNCRA